MPGFTAACVRVHDCSIDPAPYSVSDNYTGGLLQVDRDLSIVCTIRWHAQVQPARTRVFQWVTEAVKELGVESTSQVRARARVCLYV